MPKEEKEQISQRNPLSVTISGAGASGWKPSLPHQKMWCKSSCCKRNCAGSCQWNSFVQKHADRQSDNDNNKTKGKHALQKRVPTEPDCPERLWKFLHCYSTLWKIKIFKPLSWMTGEDRSNLEQTDGSDAFLKFLWNLSSVTNIHVVSSTLCKLFSKIK